jgi:purine-binding chemotaxis protein CheW
MKEELEIIEQEINEDYNEELEKQYLVFNIGSEKFAFSIKNIKEIITKPKINKAPNLPDYYLGMTKLRNDILPVISLRKRLGYNLLEQENEEMISMLRKREQEHIDWLNELDNSIKEDREFRLQRDPTKCNFGRWYYQFNTDSFAILAQLKKFEEPHKKIHQIADTALDTLKEKGRAEALKIVNRAKDMELKEIIDLFDKLYQTIREEQRETAIIFMDKNSKQYGYVVDKIDRIIEINSNQIDVPDSSSKFQEYLRGIGKTGDEFYLIFNEELLK